MKSFKEFISERGKPYGDKLFNDYESEHKDIYPAEEEDTKREDEVVRALNSFFGLNIEFPAKYIKDLRVMQADPNFKHLTTPNAKTLYRGVRVLSDNIRDLNWKKKGKVYQGDYTYKAHRTLSSWDKKKAKAVEFTTLTKFIPQAMQGKDIVPAVLTTKVNNDFIFSTYATGFIKTSEFASEKEILHITGNPLKVKIEISEETYKKLMGNLV